MSSVGIRSAVVVVAVVSLASCASGAAPSPTPTATTSALSEADPLVCADLVSADGVAAALATSSAEVVEAVQPSHSVDLAVLSSAGGLACSWRIGEGQQTIGAEDGDWAYLTIEVLPQAADEWVAPYAGDVPSDERRTIADVEATTAISETGWRISAPVGDAWVDLQITSSGRITGGSRFEGTDDAAVLDTLADAAETTFSAIVAASPEQLTWPTLPFRDGDAACDGGLAQSGIESALQLDGAAVTYTLVDPRVEPIGSLTDAVLARVGGFTCALFAEGYGQTDITVIRDFAPILDQLAAQPDTSSAFEAITLEGAVDGESAVAARRDDGPRSPLYFTVGETFYGVASADGPVTVAEAIIAQTR